MAKLLSLPRQARGAYCSRQLNSLAVEVLSGIQVLGGGQALDQACVDLAVTALTVLAHERGRAALRQALGEIRQAIELG